MTTTYSCAHNTTTTRVWRVVKATRYGTRGLAEFTDRHAATSALRAYKAAGHALARLEEHTTTMRVIA